MKENCGFPASLLITVAAAMLPILVMASMLGARVYHEEGADKPAHN